MEALMGGPCLVCERPAQQGLPPASARLLFGWVEFGLCSSHVDQLTASGGTGEPIADAPGLDLPRWGTARIAGGLTVSIDERGGVAGLRLDARRHFRFAREAALPRPILALTIRGSSRTSP